MKCDCPCHCNQSCNECGCVGCTCNDEETDEDSPSKKGPQSQGLKIPPKNIQIVKTKKKGLNYETNVF